MENKTEIVPVSEEYKMLKICAGRVVYATRKFHGYGQMELSKEFNVSQSNVSKIEAGILLPDLRLWMELSSAFKIKDPYCFSYGTVEIEGIPKLGQVGKNFYKNTLFRIPKDYQKSEALITGRKIRPLIDVFERTLPELWSDFLKDTKVLRGIFDILNFPIPGLLVKDLADFYNQHASIINLSTALDLTSQANHGLMFEHYGDSKTPLASLKYFLSRQREYGIDFEYTITKEKGSDSCIGVRTLSGLNALFSKNDLANNGFFNFCAQYPIFLMKMSDKTANPSLIYMSDEISNKDLVAPSLQTSSGLRVA